MPKKQRTSTKLNEKGGQVNETNTARHYSIDVGGWTQVRISSVLADQDELERLRDENAKLREALASLRDQVAGEREVYLERDGTKESDKYAVYMQGLLDKASAMSLPGVRYRIAILKDVQQ